MRLKEGKVRQRRQKGLLLAQKLPTAIKILRKAQETEERHRKDQESKSPGATEERRRKTNLSDQTNENSSRQSTGKQKAEEGAMDEIFNNRKTKSLKTKKRSC